MALSIKLLIFFFALAGINFSFAQKETSHWYFGDQCGLDFRSGDPKPLQNGAIKTINGGAVISNRMTGDLLFYTDGRNFWNRNHEVMQNVHTLPYNCFTIITQPAIIIPSVDNEFLFHVFCIRASFEIPPNDLNHCTYAVDKTKVPEGESALSLFYYLIDMRLNNGMGNVVESESNILLQTNITEKLTAIPHVNGKDYWIMVHGWRNNTFYTYHWAEGRILELVTTDIGSVHGNYGGIYFEYEVGGELKASPDGKKIASAVFDSERPFDLFDFDASTGKLSNYVNLGNVKGQYGVSFSPDNSKLYVGSDTRDSSSNLLTVILQYDLLAGAVDAIAASGESVIINNPDTNIPRNGILDGWSTAAKGMALALDGRLYISGNEPRDGIEENHILVVVGNPNRLGFGCNISYERFDFGYGRTAVGLPNYMQSYFDGLKPVAECAQAALLKVYPNPTTGSLTVEIPQGCSGQYLLSATNALGQTVLLEEAVVSGDEVDLQNLADGMYFLRFISPNNEIVKRIAKISGF